MRLINTVTLRLEEFHGTNIPDYAILSHTWGTEEVTFDDLVHDSHKKMGGYAKFKNSCAYAASNNWRYMWIDTCCIDKRSSAELSESINSMFEWYRSAAICYAYLADVDNEFEAPQQLRSAFRKSRWFTRGWTLQELLAPSEIIFMSSDWKEIGSKSSLNRLICQITGISNLTNYMDASVARKFSWMSKRATTRVEDMAYCLFGLFNINLPLIYGEGKNAFQRLQHEVLARTNDESIFAWKYPDDVDATEMLLAPSPEYFRDSGDIESHDFVGDRRPWSMTNIGLHIEVPLAKKNNGLFEAQLNCRRMHTSTSLGLCLNRGTNGLYRRVGLIEHFAPSKMTKREDIIVEHVHHKHPTDVWRCQIEVFLPKRLQAQGIDVAESSLIYNHRPSQPDDVSVPNTLLFDSTATSSGRYDALGRVKIYHDECIVLLLTPKRYPQIGVIFGHTPTGAWVDIILDIRNLRVRYWLEERRLNTDRYTDRISRLIRPGLSVTATLRKTNFSSMIHPPPPRLYKEPNYELFLDLGNDRLRWPELREEHLPDTLDSVSVSSLVVEHGQRRWM